MALPKAKVTIRWRPTPEGSFRPRFTPGPRERTLGFKGEDLKDDAGAWMTIEAALTWSIGKHAEIVAARSAAASKVIALRPPKPVALDRTTEALMRDWLASPAVKVDCAESTAIGYAKDVRAAVTPVPGGKPLEAEFAKLPAAAVTPGILKRLFDHVRAVRSLGRAHAVVNVFSAAWKWGRTDAKWEAVLGPNPRYELTLPTPDGRRVVFDGDEIAAMIAAADAIGRPSIGDNILLGLYIGARLGDRLRMKDCGLEDGRRKFIARKTDTTISIPDHPMLAARLMDAKARVAKLAAKFGTAPDTIVVNEKTGLPYKLLKKGGSEEYLIAFNKVKAAAVAGLIDVSDPKNPWIVRAPCPSVAEKTDRDLRDTAVTRMFRSGSHVFAVCAVSGHSPKSADLIRKHYLGHAPELADRAMENLIAWENKMAAA